MFSIIPRNTAFFDLFEQAAQIIVRSAEAFVGLARDYGNRDSYLLRIRQLEHDGDEAAHKAHDRLDRSFITPFDREDIQALMNRMDDVIDEIDAAAKRLSLYRITEPTPAFIKQADVLLQACRLLEEAVRRLRNLKKPNGLQETLVEIHYLENVGDEINHAAVAELFEKVDDPLYVLKWKEIHDLTERAIDRCEDIANTIRGIALKNS